eukprot:m.242961 g.242961  ORF g.242961 m.242961 type:complete len:267 (-) comp39327_c0_seq1:134-934(-)
MSDSESPSTSETRSDKAYLTIMTTTTTSMSGVDSPVARRLQPDVNNTQQLKEEQIVWKRLTKEQKMQLLGMELTSQERETVATTLADANTLARLAYWYQWAAMIMKSLLILLGVAVPVLIGLQDQTSNQDVVDGLKFTAIGLSALSTLLIGIEGYYKFTERGQKMNEVAIKIKHHFLQYRGLTGKNFGPPEEDDGAPMMIPNLSGIPISVLKALVAEIEKEGEKKDPWETHTGASFKKFVQLSSNLTKKGFVTRDAVFDSGSDADA